MASSGDHEGKRKLHPRNAAPPRERPVKEGTAEGGHVRVWIARLVTACARPMREPTREQMRARAGIYIPASPSRPEGPRGQAAHVASNFRPAVLASLRPCVSPPNPRRDSRRHAGRAAEKSRGPGRWLASAQEVDPNAPKHPSVEDQQATLMSHAAPSPASSRRRAQPPERRKDTYKRRISRNAESGQCWNFGWSSKRNIFPRAHHEARHTCDVASPPWPWLTTKNVLRGRRMTNRSGALVAMDGLGTRFVKTSRPHRDGERVRARAFRASERIVCFPDYLNHLLAALCCRLPSTSLFGAETDTRPPASSPPSASQLHHAVP